MCSDPVEGMPKLAPVSVQASRGLCCLASWLHMPASLAAEKSRQSSIQFRNGGIRRASATREQKHKKHVWMPAQTNEWKKIKAEHQSGYWSSTMGSAFARTWVCMAPFLHRFLCHCEARSPKDDNSPNSP